MFTVASKPTNKNEEFLEFLKKTSYNVHDLGDLTAYIEHNNIDLYNCFELYPLFIHVFLYDAKIGRFLREHKKIAINKLSCKGNTPIANAFMVDAVHVKKICNLYNEWCARQDVVYTLQTTCLNGAKGDCDTMTCCLDGVPAVVLQRWTNLSEPEISTAIYPINKFCVLREAIIGCQRDGLGTKYCDARIDAAVGGDVEGRGRACDLLGKHAQHDEV